VAIGIDDVFDLKTAALDAHVSQVYEWLPWVDGTLDTVPKDTAERKRWLAQSRAGEVTPDVRRALQKWYGADRAGKIAHAEAFEICEYGRQPSDDELRHLFPMLPRSSALR
jgi:ferric-dicitrate binding protein FerR (iron transport regulator)